MNVEQKTFVPTPLFRRFVAFAIDVSIISMIINVLVLILALIAMAIWGIPNQEDLIWKMQTISMRQMIFLLIGLMLLVLVMAAIWHLYFIFCEHMYQKTPGKKALGLSVVSLDGKPLSFKQAMLREILRCYVDMLFVVPGFLCLLLSKKKQRIGDIATNTLVVYSEAATKESCFLYLSQAQYEFRREKYKMLDASLEEANRFLVEAKTLLVGQSVVPSLGEEFVAKVLVVQDASFEDSYEMKFRFVAESLLQARRAA